MKAGLFILPLVAAAAPAFAFELSAKGDFRCRITIDDEVRLDGPCSYYPDMAEGFDVADGKGLVVILRIENGIAKAGWNGPDKAPYPDIPLGKVTRNGECWVNNKTSICVANPAN